MVCLTIMLLILPLRFWIFIMLIKWTTSWNFVCINKKRMKSVSDFLRLKNWCAIHHSSQHRFSAIQFINDNVIRKFCWNKHFASLSLTNRPFLNVTTVLISLFWLCFVKRTTKLPFKFKTYKKSLFCNLVLTNYTPS